MSIELTPSNPLALIALEARTNPFTMINSAIKDNLLNLSRNVTERLSSVSKTMFTQAPPNALKLNPKTAMAAVGDTPYLDMTKIAIPVPEGFKGDYLAYTKKLQECFDGMSDIVPDTLEPVADALAVLVTHPERATGVTSSSLRNAISYPDQITVMITNDLAEFFVRDSTLQQQAYGDLFERNKDLEMFFDAAGKLYKAYSTRPTEKVLAAINVISETSDLLYDRLKSGKLTELQNASAEFTADILSRAAATVEAYGALCTLIEQLLAYAANVYRRVITLMQK